MTRRAAEIFWAVLALTLLFAGCAAGAAIASTGAADAVPAAGDALYDVAGSAFRAFRDGNPTAGGLLAACLAVGLLRRYGSRRWPSLSGDLGGALLLSATALTGALAARAASGGWAAVADGHTLWAAFRLAAAAGGGYSLVRRLGGWALSRWGDRLPAWLRAALKVLTWAFDKAPPSAEEQIAEAEAAGAAAVAAKPPVGFGPTGRLP